MGLSKNRAKYAITFESVFSLEAFIIEITIIENSTCQDINMSNWD
jgi:hypothetical protein